MISPFNNLYTHDVINLHYSVLIDVVYVADLLSVHIRIVWTTILLRNRLFCIVIRILRLPEPNPV